MLPGLSRHSLKFGASYMVTDAWKVGFTGRAVSGKFLVGDESNLNPKTDPYVLMNFVTSYALTPKATIFGVVQNVFNAKYASFGTFSPSQRSPDPAGTRRYRPAEPQPWRATCLLWWYAREAELMVGCPLYPQ